MKTLQTLFFFSLLVVFSCSTKQQKTEAITPPVADQPKGQQAIKLKAGELIPSVICTNDPSQSYALYLPVSYSDSLRFPVILFFDPHASGSYPVGMYKSLADRFGYILMGSNNSKNGLQFDQTNAIVNALIAEAGSRFSSDKKRISLSGFSGGAKVALVAATNHPELLSVIYCGASISFDKIQKFPPALGFAGKYDMNYTEVLLSASALDENKIIHSIVEWKGKHEWPDILSFEDAFYWCSFAAMRSKIISVNNPLIKTFLLKKNKAISSRENKLGEFGLYGQVISFLRGLTDVSSYEHKMIALVQSVAFRKEQDAWESMLQTENNMKQNYGQCFESKDLNWWKEETTRMRNIKGEQEQMYQRLLGYLSLASYSYSNNAIKQNNFSAAQQFLSVYELADPGNAEQSFLTACMYARQGLPEKAIASLKESLQEGLKDKAKIKTEESFSSLHSNAEFNALIGGL